MSGTHSAHTVTSAIRPGDFVVLRTPLLPFEELVKWSAGMSTSICGFDGQTGSQTISAWQEDRTAARSRLRDVLPKIQLALTIASPSLIKGLEYWLLDPDSKRGLQAERALVRYFTRMCTRPTPFGLFSGCSLGALPDTEKGFMLQLRGSVEYRVASRLDHSLLCTLVAELHKDSAVARSLLYDPNPTLYRCGVSWYYIEELLSGQQFCRSLVQIESDEYVEHILARSAHGATFDQLVQHLVGEDPTISEEDAEAFVDEVIANRVLVSRLAPALTGESALDSLLAHLRPIPNYTSLVDQLEGLKCQLQLLNEKGLSASSQDVERVMACLGTLPGQIDPSRSLQVDMMKPVEQCWVGDDVIAAVTEGIEILCRLQPTHGSKTLQQFKTAFLDRYGCATVPLLEAVHDDIGIGFGEANRTRSKVLRDLQAVPETVEASSRVPMHGLLHRRILGALKDNSTEIDLKLTELPLVRPDLPALAESFLVSATLAVSTSSVRDAADFQVYVRFGYGPSAACFLSRFCHADPELTRCVQDLIRSEEHDDGPIYADVVHLPEPRAGNVVSRPVLRKYEIPFLASSGAATDCQLRLSDLYVRVENDRVVLFSASLGREVIPRITNAHNFNKPDAPAVYRFLGHLQMQGRATVPQFDWPGFNDFDFLPRLRVGRVVISLARWRISESESHSLTSTNGYDRFRETQELRQRRGLPRWVQFEEFDNLLPIDLDNPLSVDTLAHLLSRVRSATLIEMFPDPGSLAVEGPEGRFQHELCIPFLTRRKQLDCINIAARKTAMSAACRKKPLGSDWLYVKVYGGIAVVDSIIRTTLPLLRNVATQKGLANRWFFVRYADPAYHLRVRFNGPPESMTTLLPEIIRKTLEPLLSSGTIWKLEYSTYDREIERYGGAAAMDVTEDIFSADSDAVVELLQAIGLDDEDLRIRCCLVSTDNLLSDLGYSLQSKLGLLDHLRETYHRAFKVTATWERILGLRYRSMQPSLLLPAEDGGTDSLIREILKVRSSRIQRSATRLRELEGSGQLHQSRDSIAASLVHMHVNRMMRDEPNLHEVALYDFLCRLYKQAVNRARG